MAPTTNPRDILDIERGKINLALSVLPAADLLRELSSMAPLPVEGLLAGQALASIIMAKLGVSSHGPYNDVDVFLTSSCARGSKMVELDQFVAPRRLSSLGSHITDVGAWRDNYSAITRSTVKQGYKICVVSRRGMLNEIVFERFRNNSLPEHKASDALLLIRGFDLNCTQVALDLSTGELTWTQAFAEFLLTHALRVESSSTPMHSATRYFRKKQELHCQGDDALNMAICAVRSLNGDFEPAPTTMRRMQSQEGRYGRKTYEEFRANEKLLEPWFTQEKVDGTEGLWTMKPNESTPGGAFESIKLALGGAGLHAHGAWSSGYSLGSLLQCHATEFARQVLRPEDQDVVARMESIELLDKAFAAHPDAKQSTAKPLCQAFALIKTSDWSSAEPVAYNALAELLAIEPDYFDTLCAYPVKEQGEICERLLRAHRKHGEIIHSALIIQDVHGNLAKLSALLHDEAALDAFCHEHVLQSAIQKGDEQAFERSFPHVELAPNDSMTIHLVYSAICSGNAKIVEALRPIISSVVDWPKNRHHPIMEACTHSNAKVVDLLLTCFPDVDIARMNVEGRDFQSRVATETTALMLAANYGKSDIVELLLAFGGADQKNSRGLDALGIAVLNGSSECFELLLPHGDLHQVDIEGCNLLHRAASTRFNKESSLRNLVYLAGVINPLTPEPQHGWSPLAIAIKSGNLQAVETLLPLSNLSALDHEGSTPLHIAKARVEASPHDPTRTEIANLIERYERAMDEREVLCAGSQPIATSRPRRSGL